MSSALWWVTNGLAAAPPGIGCIIGVSTSRKPRASRKARTVCDERGSGARKTSRTSGFTSEVHVALAVARLDVLEPVPLLGQRPQGLGEELERA